MMVHELRSPLDATTKMIDMMKSKRLVKAKRDEYLGMIYNSSSEMLGLVNNLLDVAKTVDPKKLTGYKEFNGHSEPQEWKLVTLSQGVWTTNRKGVSYPVWDGEKIVSMILWGDKQFKLQPGAIYTFTISEANIASHGDKIYNNARLLFEKPIFEESLLFLKNESEPIEETPLLPKEKR